MLNATYFVCDCMIDSLVISAIHSLQVWNLTNCRLKINHSGHTGYLNTVTVSPDGSLCASGGKVCITYHISRSKHINILIVKSYVNCILIIIYSVRRIAKLCCGI